MMKVEMRTTRSDDALVGHTEKLIILTSAVTQLAANEARQTDALRSMERGFETSLTGCAARITNHFDERSEAVIRACSPRS
jgi:hypothetical protein